MAKYDITQLSDLVRGVADPVARKSMREYLDISPRARRQVDLLERVAAVARADQEMRIPDHALRIVKALGSLRRPEAQPSRGLLPFKIAFDSFLQPAAAGTRDIQARDRQLVVHADPYRVDLRLEQESEQSSVVVGQLLRDGIHPMSDVPVLLLAGGRVVGRSTTSEFGEFQAEGLPRQPLKLCLLIESDKNLEVPLATPEETN